MFSTTQILGKVDKNTIFEKMVWFVSKMKAEAYPVFNNPHRKSESAASTIALSLENLESHGGSRANLGFITISLRFKYRCDNVSVFEDGV